MSENQKQAKIYALDMAYKIEYGKMFSVLNTNIIVEGEEKAIERFRKGVHNLDAAYQLAESDL